MPDLYCVEVDVMPIVGVLDVHPGRGPPADRQLEPVGTASHTVFCGGTCTEKGSGRSTKGSEKCHRRRGKAVSFRGASSTSTPLLKYGVERLIISVFFKRVLR